MKRQLNRLEKLTDLFACCDLYCRDFRCFDSCIGDCVLSYYNTLGSHCVDCSRLVVFERYSGKQRITDGVSLVVTELLHCRDSTC